MAVLFTSTRGILALICFLILNPLASACWGNSPCNGPLEASFPGPWENYMHSPSSRLVSPKSILNSDTSFQTRYPSLSKLAGNGSLVIFDFGQEVGGIVNINYTTNGAGTLGLAFTEAKNFTGFNSDESNGGSTPDGALLIDISSDGSKTYSMPLDKMRGGFRYLSVFTLTNSTDFNVTVDTVDVEITFQPSWPNLRAYGGYFHSSDELLNRIWYACVYTLQANNIPPTSGRTWPAPTQGWENDADLGLGYSVLVDGAKRDRAVWAGDLGISVPASLVGLGDFESSKTSLNILYINQDPTTGELPEVGPPINFFGSDSYHLATMIATHDYILYSNDMEFLQSIWQNYTQAMTFIISRIDSTGLLNVTGSSGWGRSADASGYNIVGNMLMYGALQTGAVLAIWANQSDLAKEWETTASRLKSAVNSPSYNWDPSVGAFKNNPTDIMFPEDGNSIALLYGGANSSTSSNVSDYLTTNWGPIGAETPEMPGTISPYVESYEVKGNFKIRNTKRALDLIRLSWGWYINNLMGTGSSMIEGYNVDGSFLYTANEGYDKSGSYISHAHGWSTGPVDGLVSYVVGLQPTAPGGANWTLAPQKGDLSSAQGGFTTPLGRFSASWEIQNTGFILQFDTPASTQGLMQLEVSNSAKVLVDGQAYPINRDPVTGLSEISVSGGKHVVILQ
ncbi:uncharacterized protein N7443_005432 [Penicillium atrosanguineum]|uniref:uncharacterized protein n=1 Tax=Penicillium atrosanguineum TaxID=1132637 RepID=UPI00239D8D56|nr:uncharacterized protein N7443_005432 [Penicillium atrosanguineum]KAJ5300430.1 hypothetical protein N7443_005432 [Penicillium atrosanguineum]